MHRESFTTRLRIGVASAAALAVVAFTATFASVASAGIQAVAFDPENTNVPYLAWRGEELRLVKCFPVGSAGAAATTGKFFIEDWSGNADFKPNFGNDVSGLVSSFVPASGEHAGETCFAVDVVSLKAGLAIIKLKVFAGTAGGTVLAEHQFLAAWMNIASATVTDIGPTSVPLTTSTAPQNQVQVVVTGTIPMENNFDETNARLGRAPGTPLTMPNDWAALAGVMARSSFAGNEANPLLWDIHDDFTGVPGGAAPSADVHQIGGACAGTSTTTDNVDNCLGGDEFGPFSRFVHTFAAALGLPDMTNAPVIGPFDPKRLDTYLPDGLLNAGDAPMPSARVDVRMAPGGTGQLVPVDKHVVYSRSGTGSSAAHDLWAPFYAAFLPATSATTGLGAPDVGFVPEPAASGVSGGDENNFHGFVNNGGAGGFYHFWDFAVAIGRSATTINCPPFIPGVPAQTPSGITDVTVYTDEHGEARVGFNAGVGFNLPAGTITNANGGCDIQGLNPVGTAVISADARYPFQMITAADVPGNSVVTKTVTSLFNKQITCVPKGTGLANQVAFICTALAIGANGLPFANETVCFISNAEAIMPAPGFTMVTNPGITGAAVVCVNTNASGQASVEIFGKGTLNVIANFTAESLLRFITLGPPTTVPLTPGGTSPTTPPAAAATQPVTSTTPPTTSQVVSLGGNVTPTKPTRAQKPTVLSARIVSTKSGRALKVRIRSTKPTAKIRVVMRGARGRTIATAVRTVRTNRAVVVPNLRIARNVARVTVTALS